MLPLTVFTNDVDIYFGIEMVAPSSDRISRVLIARGPPLVKRGIRLVPKSTVRRHLLYAHEMGRTGIG